MEHQIKPEHGANIVLTTLEDRWQSLEGIQLEGLVIFAAGPKWILPGLVFSGAELAEKYVASLKVWADEMESIHPAVQEAAFSNVPRGVVPRPAPRISDQELMRLLGLEDMTDL